MSSLDMVMAAASEVDRFCRDQGWRFCFIGGVAVQRWGMPRFTQDVDLTLLTGLGSEDQFIAQILREYTGRIPDAREFALTNRVLLARTRAGIDLDFSLGAFPFEEGSVERASVWRPNDRYSITTCSAEDLVIHKVFASRDRDWSDVETVLARQFQHLDFGLIRRELPALLALKDDSDPLERFEKMVTAVSGRIQKKTQE